MSEQSFSPDDQRWVDVLSACSRLVRTTLTLAGEAPGSTTWRILSTLDRGGWLRVGQIADSEQTSQATASRIIARLTREGLVTSRPDPDDGRSQLIGLSQHGREELLSYRARYMAALRPNLESLTPEQVEDIVRGARAIEVLIAAEHESFESH